MKTPLETVFKEHDTSFDKMDFLRWLSKNRSVLLQKEKEVIITAFDEGTENYNTDSQDTVTAEDYYQETFNRYYGK